MNKETTGSIASEKHQNPRPSQVLEVIRVTATRDQVDFVGDVIYSQIKSMRSMRQLHVSVLVPRNEKLKPAIIYFPGGGFTSSEHNKFLEMRMALAEAGFSLLPQNIELSPTCI